jgi:transposase
MNNTTTEQLFKFDQNVEVIHSLMEPEDLYVVIKVCSAHTRCPGCKHLSSRRHSRYARKADDLPVSDRSVHLTILLHKWFCVNAKCEIKIFTDPFRLVTSFWQKNNSARKIDSLRWILQ